MALASSVDLQQIIFLFELQYVFLKATESGKRE